MSGGRSGSGSWRRGATGGSSTAAASSAGTRTIGHPDVAIAIDVNAVRRRDHAGAEMRDQVPVGVELENRVERRAHATVRATPLGDPDARAILVDVDGARRSPGAALGHLRPALDGLIWVG